MSSSFSKLGAANLTLYVQGEIEITMMNTFCQMSNFRGLMFSAGCPEILDEHLETLDRFIGRTPRSTLNNDIASLENMGSQTHASKHHTLRHTSYGPLDHDILKAFTEILSPELQPKNLSEISDVFHLHRIMMGGVQYTDYITAEQDSIIFFEAASGSNWLPARIRDIFQHTRRTIDGHIQEEIFVALHHYLPTNPSKEDPFACYTDFRAALFSQELSRAVLVIQASQVKCHAIRRPWDEQSYVFRPLNRVKCFI